MSRGQTWSSEEVQALIDIWSDEQISRLLVVTHKNFAVFRLFSEKMAARGFNRTPHQCRIKVKKLRQRYFWVRDLTQKIGSSVEEKSRFVWYKDLDGILGRRPTSSQQKHEVDIKEEVALTAVTEEPPHRSESSVNCDLDKRGVQSCGELHSEEEESTATSQSPSPQQNDTPWWGAPSTQDRKLKSGSGGLESLLEGYMQHKRQMDEADQKRHEELKTGFENFMRMQQEAEERWFSAIQERQQANSQLFMYMMETFAKALLPQSHTTSGQWMPPMFSYSCTTHNTASPQNFENPVESLASYLLDNMAPHTSSSLLHDDLEITRS